MIIVTGAFGFIPSCLISRLNREGYKDIIAVDDFSVKRKESNLLDKEVYKFIDRSEFISWFRLNANIVDFVFHLGARTDTTERSEEIFNSLNLFYSKEVWSICADFNIPIVYASSAATYGNGEFGYSDNYRLIQSLKPLNPYARSKHDFDLWVLSQGVKPDFWVGLKFFNVYGPNEYHKGKMASVIYHCFNQVSSKGRMSLFESHREGIPNGHQKRDFIYVKDVIDVCLWLMLNRKTSGIFNLGSGKARTFEDLVTSTFNAMGLEPIIDYTPTPIEIRDSYQYFTQAEMGGLRLLGYMKEFTTLEDGIDDYVKNYLVYGKHE